MGVSGSTRRREFVESFAMSRLSVRYDPNGKNWIRKKPFHFISLYFSFSLSLSLSTDTDSDDSVMLSPLPTTDDERTTERSHRGLPSGLVETMDSRRVSGRERRLSSASEYDIFANRMMPKLV